ncbi:MAG: GAF domain-containing protein, partial [Chloroflexi bacterium]|nr:GAF domain-containing protein [Chloroflexota bacterium]
FQKYLDTPINERDERLQQETSSSLQNLIKKDPLYIKSHALVNAKGVVVLDTNLEAIGISYAGEDFFERPLETNLPYVSDVKFLSNGSAVLYFTSPVHGEGGDTVGVLVVTYDAAILQKWLVQNNSILGTTSFPILLDENHIRLAHGTAPDLNFKSLVPLSADKLAELQGAGRLPNLPADELSTNLPAFDQALTNADATPNFTTQLVATDEESNYGTAVYMQTRPWQVAYFQPVSVYLEPLQEQARGSLLVTIGIGLVVALAAVFVSQALSGPITRLTAVAEKVSAGDINAQAEIESSDEIGTLARAFNGMTSRLREFINTLEARVAERTHNLELAAEVGRTVSHVRALDVMLTEAAELIRKQFDLYYVQVYLANPSQTYLVLQAGTGTVGKELLERNHRLPLNPTSLNGRAAVEKKSVVISNTLKSVTFKPNPLLPQTRSEISVPLMVGDALAGVLDMQSVQEDALNEDVLPAFEALAGQIAIAIQNAKFLAETQQARAEVEAQARRLVRASWLEYMDAVHKPEQTGFVFENERVFPQTEMETPQQTDENTVAAPISITGETVGNLVVKLDERSSALARSGELVEEVARLVAQHIESLRLLETAERFRAEAEEASRRLVREGWKDYVQTNAEKTLGYYFDLKEVRPYNSNGGQQPIDVSFDLPLKVRDEVIGKLAVQGIEEENTEARNLAFAVAERLSAHIEGLRQFDETRRGQIELDKRARQLSAVAEVSTASSRELDIQTMLETVVRLTQRKFGYYHAHVFTFNEDTQHLKIAACGWKEGDEHEGTHGETEIPLMQEQSLVARAGRTRQAVIVNDVRNEPGWLANSLLPDTASELAVPLLVGEQLLGVLDVQSDSLNAFTEEDANIQTTLASQVATALQNAHSFSKAQLQAQRESTLNIINQKIQSATTVEAVLQIAARELGHALGAPMTIAQLSMKDTSA